VALAECSRLKKNARKSQPDFRAFYESGHIAFSSPGSAGLIVVDRQVSPVRIAVLPEKPFSADVSEKCEEWVHSV
jgi:hypothetical protein